MRPSVVILGFVLGSAGAITFSLTGVAIVFGLLRTEYPRLATEIGPLLAYLAVSALLTACAALSFYGEIKGTRWRRVSQGALAAGLIAIAASYVWAD